MSGETVPPPQQRENGGHTPPQRATPFHRRVVFWRQHPAQAGDPYGRYGVTPPPTTSGDMAAIPTAGEPSPHRATPAPSAGGVFKSVLFRRRAARERICSAAHIPTADCPAPNYGLPLPTSGDPAPIGGFALPSANNTRPAPRGVPFLGFGSPAELKFFSNLIFLFTDYFNFFCRFRL
mgnify:CR=1 FL=1